MNEELLEQLNKIKECVASIATMMDALPNPAIAVVGISGEKKAKHKKAEVDKEQDGLQKETK